MDFLDDPEEMTPEERLSELAAILATGCHRMRETRAELASSAASTTPTEKRLDCPGAPMPLLDTRLTPRETTTREGSA
jgi:hypothetical protein